MKEIERLSNPVIMKQAKQILLHYKQKHYQAFQNICLYSDVCKMVSENCFRLGPRRLIQELFLEVNFEVFRKINNEILSTKKKPVIVTPDEEKSDLVMLQVKNRLLSTKGIEDRKLELSAAKVVSLQPSRSVIRGFKIETQSFVEEKGEYRLSPSKNEPHSPPLTSVEEENTASAENLLSQSKEDSNCKTEPKTTLPTIKTLDSLHLTCSENKFPIKNRNDTNVIK